jgi:hypothetical protein
MTYTFVSRKTNTRKMTIRGERAKSTVEYGETVFKLNRPSVHTYIYLQTVVGQDPTQRSSSQDPITGHYRMSEHLGHLKQCCAVIAVNIDVEMRYCCFLALL